jgi:hypothetical protein
MQKIAVLMASLCLLSGCSKSISSVKNEMQQLKRIPILEQFQVKVEGVECAICAQDAVDIVKCIAGVHSADFVVNNADYEQGHVRFYYDISEKNFDLKALDDQLQTIGFEVATLRGVFYIEPFSADGKKYIALSDEVAMPFCYNDVELLKKAISARPQKVCVQGYITRDAQDNSYYFTFVGPA